MFSDHFAKYRKLSSRELRDAFSVRRLWDTLTDKKCLKAEFRIGDLKTGYATVEVDPEKEIFTWYEFFPHKDAHGMKHRGLGTLADIYTRLAMQAYARDHYAVDSTPVLWERKPQLESMGIQPADNFGEQLRKSLEYARKRGLYS